MNTALTRRIDRLEINSPWGSKSELEATDVIFMHVPEGGGADPRVTAARIEAERKGKSFCATSAPAAAELPLWTQVPIEKIPDALLDDRIEHFRMKLAAAASDELPPCEPAAIDLRLAELITRMQIWPDPKAKQ